MEGERRRGQTLIGISLHTYGLSEGAVPLAKAVGVQRPLDPATGDWALLVQARAGWAPLVWAKGSWGLSVIQWLLHDL